MIWVSQATTTPFSHISDLYRNRDGSTAQPGTPVGHVIGNVNGPQLVQEQIEPARTLQQPSSPRLPGKKRAAFQGPERPSEGARSSDQVVNDVDAPQPAIEALQLSWEQLCNVACDSSLP